MMNSQDLPHEQTCAAWSNRLLIISLLGIAYLTLFPFRPRYIPWESFSRPPFLLGASEKGVGNFHFFLIDFFLNVLLFVPLGFALSAQARKRKLKLGTSLVLAIVLGAFASYAVEFIQLFIPQRDSGWNDVISNTTGSVVGFVLFEVCGGFVLGVLAECETFFLEWISPSRVALLLALYFTVWFGISVRLQSETLLTNWDPQCTLLLGNDATGAAPWRGKVYLLQIWNRALPQQTIQRLASREAADDAASGLIASYDFTSPEPFRDRTNRMPTLDWAPSRPRAMKAPLELDGASWLTTGGPAENLTRAIKDTNHFTVHIVCAPAASAGASGRIVSLSQSLQNVNFHIRQQRDGMFFYFRNPLSERRSNLVWFVPSVFIPGETRDIVAEYDGSDAYIYVDGMSKPPRYRLGPGASLIHKRLSIQIGDLDGYTDVYETLVFLPAGFLIGLAAWNLSERKAFLWWVFVLGWILPAVVLEVLLVAESGRSVWVGNIVMSLVFGLMGMLIANADRYFVESERAEMDFANSRKAV